MSKRKKKQIEKLYTVQSNDFIRRTMYSHFSINDLRIFKLIISKVNYNDSLFNDFYILTYQELEKIGVKANKNRYETVSDSLKKLAAFYVKYYSKEHDADVEVGLIENKFIYKRNTGKIMVSIHNDLKPFLLDLKKEYTTYEVENLSGLKSIYSIKTYELLKSFSNETKNEVNTYRTSVERFRYYLELKEDDYPRYSNFKQRIIKKTIEDINKNTDINISLIEHKVGRKVEDISFNITKAKQSISIPQKIIPDDFKPSNTAIKKVLKRGLKEDLIEQSIFDFIYYYQINKPDEKMADWDAAYQYWVLNAIEMKKYQ